MTTSKISRVAKDICVYSGKFPAESKPSKLPDFINKIESFLKTKVTNNSATDAQNAPMKNISHGFLSAFFGFISNSIIIFPPLSNFQVKE